MVAVQFDGIQVRHFVFAMYIAVAVDSVVAVFAVAITFAHAIINVMVVV